MQSLRKNADGGSARAEELKKSQEANASRLAKVASEREAAQKRIAELEAEVNDLENNKEKIVGLSPLCAFAKGCWSRRRCARREFASAGGELEERNKGASNAAQRIRGAVGEA